MINSDRDVFQSALSDFTFEAACGGAIRHLADSGYTARQIMERLDYPMSGERVRKALYKHLCDTGVILEKSPEEGLPEAKPEYVLEYNSYGKPSYRRKSATGSEAGAAPNGAVWKEIVYRPGTAFPSSVSKDIPGQEYCDSDWRKGKKTFRYSSQSDAGNTAGYSGRGAELSAFLTKRCHSKQEESVYISCDFGVPDSVAAKGISLLNGRQQEYLEGIPWPRHRVYHRLDHRMREILCSLYEQHAYKGICYFPSRREKVLIL